MEIFVTFLKTYETWIYALFGVVAVVYVRKLILAIIERRSTLFGLERENAQRKMMLSISVVGLLSFITLLVFITTTFVVPTLPSAKSLITPTIDILITGTATLAASEAGTPMPESAGTPAPQPTPTVAGGGCVARTLEWSTPQSGDEISGTVELTGTVNIADLGFYKYEYSQAGSEKWLTIAAGNTGVIDGTIGTWNTEQIVPGDYLLRLVVSDNTNKLLPACVVPVKIVKPY